MKATGFVIDSKLTLYQLADFVCHIISRIVKIPENVEKLNPVKIFEEIPNSLQDIIWFQIVKMICWV